MKIITDSKTLNAKITEIEIQEFKDVISGLGKFKGFIRCIMDKDEYEFLETLYRNEQTVTVKLPDNLEEFSIFTFYPPFDIRMLVLYAKYDGHRYRAALYFKQE